MHQSIALKMFRQSYSQGQKERAYPNKEDVAEAFKAKS